MKNIFFLIILFIFYSAKTLFAQEQNQDDVKTKDKILLHYNTDHFDDDTKSWQFFSIEYQFKEPFSTIIPRVNFANRFTNSGLQPEADVYLLLSEKNYFFLNTGFSDGKVFPKTRFAIEYYQIVPGNFELSAGYRYLYFSPDKINIITASVGYYFSDYWLSFRPFFVNEPGRNNKSTFTLIGRRYFADAENYLSVKAGFGSYPVSGNTQADFYRNDSKYFGIDYQFYILEKTTLQLGFLYEKEDLRIDKSRGRYNFLLSVQKIFN